MKKKSESKKVLMQIFGVFVIFIMLMGMMISSTFATSEPKLNVITDTAEVPLEDDQGYISKSIVETNEETGEITIEIKLANQKKEIVQVVQSEVMLVIDTSASMEAAVGNGLTRKQVVLNAAIELAEKIFSSSNSVKIGIVKFATGLTSGDAELVLGLTNNENEVKSKLLEMREQPAQRATNIEAGLVAGKEAFTNEISNKLMIILTDGLPTTDVSGGKNSEEVIANTKSRLINIQNSGVKIISMLTGLTNAETNQQVQKLFGTKEQPTAGIFYNIDDTSIGQVISEDIFKDIMQVVQNPMNVVKIVDYFPPEITDNFDFSYVGLPSKGTATEKIDEATKAITWEIPTIKGDEVVTLRYKLKIKDKNNKTIINKNIATNDKLVLTYQDIDGTEHSKELPNSPVIRLEGEVEEAKNELIDNTITNKEIPSNNDVNVEDNSISKVILPQTGTSIIGIILIVALIISGVFGLVKYRNYDK